MKEALRAAGIPCAQSIGSADVAEIRDFAARIGFPLIVKPRDAAGASGTMRVESSEELTAALHSFGVDRGRSVAIEEFIEGHEGFYDTISIGGEVAHEFVSHYYPNVLEAMRARWISPQFVSTNRLDTSPGYAELKEMGRAVAKVLGIETSATHMEWFYGPKGLKFSEIGCRPPGVRAWDLYAVGNEFDIYREWAMAVVHGKTSQWLSRKYAAGVIALRPDRDGVIAGYEGLEEAQRRFGPWVIDAHLPPEGTPTQPVDAGYMANAWVRMKHPDYDELRGMLDFVGRNVRVRAR
jgi:carbamoylphosphate synthase large subunit